MQMMQMMTQMMINTNNDSKTSPADRNAQLQQNNLFMQNMMLQLTQKMGSMQTQIEKLTEVVLANNTANHNNQLQDHHHRAVNEQVNNLRPQEVNTLFRSGATAVQNPLNESFG